MRSAYLLMLFIVSPACLAQIYSWRDAEGKIHYSDQAPADVANTRKVAPIPAPAETTDQATRKLAKDAIDFRKRQAAAAEAEAKADKAQVEAAERQENCKQAKSYLQSLESGARVARSDDKGERYYLDDQGRVQETATAKRAVASWCK